MNPIPAAFLIGLMVTLSRWSQGKGISVDNVLGVAGTAVVLGVLNMIDKDLARAFGALAVLAVALSQVPRIIGQAGFSAEGVKAPGSPPGGQQTGSGRAMRGGQQ